MCIFIKQLVTAAVLHELLSWALPSTWCDKRKDMAESNIAPVDSEEIITLDIH